MTPTQRSKINDLLACRRRVLISDWEQCFVERLDKKGDEPLTHWQAAQLNATYRTLGGYSIPSEPAVSPQPTPATPAATE